MILNTIVEQKILEVAIRESEIPLESLKVMAEAAPPARDFLGALTPDEHVPAVIAEAKKASPSKGVIRQNFDPKAIALSYQKAGASAISVLTDEEFFQGHLDYLRQIRETVLLPVLRKDFIIDAYQVWEARAAGADAVLLIAAILTENDLKSLLALSRDLDMAALVEVHTEEEVEKAVHSGARIIGINNRNLQTFETDLATTTKLLPRIPAGRTIVSESGILSRGDAVFLKERGVHAVLIGEAFMRADEPGEKLKEFLR